MYEESITVLQSWDHGGEAGEGGDKETSNDNPLQEYQQNNKRNKQTRAEEDLRDMIVGTGVSHLASLSMEQLPATQGNMKTIREW